MNMEVKVCNKCSIEKNINEFYNKRTECIICSKEYRKIYYKQNSDIQKQRSKLRNLNDPNYAKKYRNDNRDKVNSTAKSWRERNRKKSVESTILWRNNNKETYNQYQKLYRTNDDLVKLSSNIRNRINGFLKIKNITKKNRTFEIVGCSPQFLKEHLEKQFINGMTWENRNKWHIDHIIPLSSAKTEDEVYKLCHYTNLQPLFAEENLKKYNKLIN